MYKPTNLTLHVYHMQLDSNTRAYTFCKDFFRPLHPKFSEVADQDTAITPFRQFSH